jgi:hypothetical protein
MWRIFQHPKTTTQPPRFHHKTTITSPQITTQKHARFAKPPPKTPVKQQKPPRNHARKKSVKKQV